MDVHHMTYDDESFDVILDKGTLDAIICGDESSSNPEQALLEVNRVLKKNGVYICISYGMPEYRLDYFQSPSLKWKVVHISLRILFALSFFLLLAKSSSSAQSSQTGTEYCHHIYICRKSE